MTSGWPPAARTQAPRREDQPMRRLNGIAMMLVALLLGACGGDGNGGDDPEQQRGMTFDAAIAKARDVDPADFPDPRGRSLQQLAGELRAIDIGLATSVYAPGANRLAFGMIDKARSFVYGPTVVYLARKPNAGRVLGPFAAPADPLVVDPPYRSQGAALADSTLAAIYDAEIELRDPGRWYVLAVTEAQGKRFGAATQIQATRDEPIPGTGERAPHVDTDTLTSAGGDIEAIDTRVPADDMHSANLADVLGERPVALLFATPQLCESRVCGPVVDIAAQLESEYGDRMEFIHQEVFVDNEVDKGLRPPLRAFDLRTEPWLFTIDADGRVAARLEGSFGTVGFERAVRHAL